MLQTCVERVLVVRNREKRNSRHRELVCFIRSFLPRFQQPKGKLPWVPELFEGKKGKVVTLPTDTF
uniref:Uncharacterized protein n=1 Tax=Daphnia magna TaxID=35525 RepID=A0A0P6GDG1_9CRUS